MRRFIVINAILIIIFFQNIFSYIGGMPFEILNKEIGVKAMSLGGAYTAFAKDSNATFWNPAILDNITKNQIYFSFETFFEDTSLQNLSFVSPIGKYGGVGLNFSYVNYGKYEVVDKNANVISENEYKDIILIGSYGKSLLWGIQAGINLKVLIKILDNENFSAFNSDISFYKEINEILSTGIILRNFLPLEINYTTETEKFIPYIRWGIAIKLLNENLNFLFDIGKYFSDTQSVDFAGGIEYKIFNLLSLRMGINQDIEISGGLGVDYKSFQLDYGIVNTLLGISHKVALSYKFGGYDVSLKADPPIFSPVSANNKVYIRIHAITKYEIYKWKITLKSPKGDIIKIWKGAGAPPESVVWNGLKTDGMPYEEGEYNAVLKITDENDNIIKSKEITIKISTKGEYYVPILGD